LIKKVDNAQGWHGTVAGPDAPLGMQQTTTS
jgi:hypothetical protein